MSIDEVGQAFVPEHGCGALTYLWGPGRLAVVRTVALGFVLFAFGVASATTASASMVAKEPAYCPRLNAIATKLNMFAELQGTQQQKVTSSVSRSARHLAKSGPRAIKADLIVVAQAFANYPQTAIANRDAIPGAVRNVQGYDARHCYNPNLPGGALPTT